MEAKKSRAEKLSDSHVVALGKIVDCTKFTAAKETGIHPATRKSLVSNGFAVTDTSGTKIKVTAAGRKAHAKAQKAASQE